MSLKITPTSTVAPTPAPARVRPEDDPPVPREAGGTGRARQAGAASTAAAAPVPAPAPAAPDDAGLATPKPTRFPWLSRLSQQLESASKSKPAFAPAAMIGENVDRSV